MNQIVAEYSRLVLGRGVRTNPTSFHYGDEVMLFQYYLLYLIVSNIMLIMVQQIACQR